MGKGVQYNLSQFLHPLCSVCGCELAAIIGCMAVVCVVCDTKFDLVERKND